MKVTVHYAIVTNCEAGAWAYLGATEADVKAQLEDYIDDQFVEVGSLLNHEREVKRLLDMGHLDSAIGHYFAYPGEDRVSFHHIVIEVP